MKQIGVLLFSVLLFSGCSLEDVEDDTLINATVIESFEHNIPLSMEHRLGYESDLLIYSYLYDEQYGNWSGFAQSRCFDMEDASYDNQYSVYNEAAASGKHFLIYYYDSYNAATQPTDILCRFYGYYQFKTVRINLSTITYHTIMQGNDFARAFADGDYIKVSFIGLGDNKCEGDIVEYYAVDYRDGKRFIADDWVTVDLSALRGGLWGLRIRIETTDVGAWGANTPLYLCLDDLTYTFES